MCAACAPSSRHSLQMRDPDLDIDDPPVDAQGRPYCPEWPTHPSVLETLVSAASADADGATPSARHSPQSGGHDGGFTEAHLARFIELVQDHIEKTFPEKKGGGDVKA